MGYVADLTIEKQEVLSSLDEITIRHYSRGITGGRSLDCKESGITDNVIKAGHVIIVEDDTKTYKPMPVSGGAYASLPSGHSIVGVLRGTILVSEPFAAIMYAGEVNDEVCPFPYTESIKKALPLIMFMHD